MESISDITLMLKVKAGDLSKLGLLFERYKNPVFGFFYRNTANREISEDLVQLLFERIIRYRKNFRGEGKFTCWMYSIARNILADYYKQTKKSGNTVQFVAEITKDFNNDDHDEPEILEEKHQLLNKAMKKLDKDKLEILILSRYQGLKYKEIAEITQSTEGAVRIKIFRALGELRKHYLKLERSEAI